MIKAHLILSQTRLIFSRLTDLSSVLTEFNSIWSDFWSDSDPNPAQTRPDPRPGSGDLRPAPTRPCPSFLHPRDLAATHTVFSGLFRRKPFCSDVFCHDLSYQLPSPADLCRDLLSAPTSSALPSELARNTKLQNLDLGNSLIMRWSDLKIVSSLTSLKNLNLVGNPVAEKDVLAKKIKNLVPSLQIFNARPIDKVVKNVVDVEDMDKKEGQKMTKNKPTNTENDENTPTAGTKLKRKSMDKSIKEEEAVINSKKVRDDDDEMVHIEKNENRIEKRDDEDDVKWSIFAFCFPVVFTFPISLCKRTKKVPDIGTKKEDVGAVQRTSEQNGLRREKEDVGADASEERRVCVGRGRRRRCASQQGRVGGGSWGKDASELVGGRRISRRKSQYGEQKTAGNVFQKSEKN
ncbi:hypothetical protein LXL04_013385 [Taraxacum kok-saghyz]